jgi:cytochrome b561
MDTAAPARAETPTRPAGAPPRYDAMISSLHWIIALLMIAQVVLGLWATGLGREDPLRGSLYNLHYSFGFLVFVLAAARLAWRATHAGPPMSARFKRWEVVLAKANYVVLYGLMLALPVTGYITVAARGVGMPVFGLFEIPSLTGRNIPLHQGAENAHIALFILLAVTFSAHVLGALKHIVFDKENILARIRPM